MSSSFFYNVRLESMRVQTQHLLASSRYYDGDGWRRGEIVFPNLLVDLFDGITKGSSIEPNGSPNKINIHRFGIFLTGHGLVAGAAEDDPEMAHCQYMFAQAELDYKPTNRQVQSRRRAA